MVAGAGYMFHGSKAPTKFRAIFSRSMLTNFNVLARGRSFPIQILAAPVEPEKRTDNSRRYPSELQRSQ